MEQNGTSIWTTSLLSLALLGSSITALAQAADNGARVPNVALPKPDIDSTVKNLQQQRELTTPSNRPKFDNAIEALKELKACATCDVVPPTQPIDVNGGGKGPKPRPIEIDRSRSGSAGNAK